MRSGDNVGVELRQIEYFVAVAEESSFTRAAERSQVSQSGLSAAIRSLERELGSSLFHRTTRSVQLSRAGMALLPKAREMLRLATAGRDAVAATTAGLQGFLRLGAEQCLGVIDPPALLERFKRREPGIDIAFTQAGSAFLLRQLREEQLDIAFVARPESSRRGDDLHWIQLSQQGLVLLSAPATPLAHGDEVAWEDLEGLTFVDFEEGWGARELSDLAFAARGVNRRVQYTVNDVHTLLDMVRRGLGVALVPEPVSRKPQAEGLAVRRPAVAGSWVVSIATRPALVASPHVAVFLELTAEEAGLLRD
ncbi:hypothetical protein SMF913_12068 [Streptomyces malaysiensis]|uniref:HTH lysR-type domain-containing protein n=1 Tax=Streptomyces malaysiensis TaxID=92644 RepID=A0A2J7Z6Z7_STRMQ|nr:hypothetical protein SMF913_12068 [Streptomyces malaysiensis]